MLNCRALRHVVCFVALCTSLTTACNRRTFYRVQADREAQYLVQEKSNDPRWAMPGFNIALDPRSRYFDPYPVDATPMPTDDPASHVYMHRVNGMKGWPKWHQWGERGTLGNGTWCQYLSEYVDMTAAGEVILNLESRPATCLHAFAQ